MVRCNTDLFVACRKVLRAALRSDFVSVTAAHPVFGGGFTAGEPLRIACYVVGGGRLLELHPYVRCGGSINAIDPYDSNATNPSWSLLTGKPYEKTVNFPFHA